MVLRDEIKEEDGSGSFATSGGICRGSLSIDVDAATFLGWIDFELYWTATVGNKPLNVHVPFKIEEGKVNTALTEETIAKSFVWRIRTNQDHVHQVGGHNIAESWRSSASLDANGRYTPAAEYEFQQKDTIIIEAQPIAANASGDTCRLFASVHIYKMLQGKQRIQY
jgi:hypothetical protein